MIIIFVTQSENILQIVFLSHECKIFLEKIERGLNMCVRTMCGRGPVDGRFLVWWVINNVVWTDYWLSIAGAGCGLTGVGAGEEQARKVVAREASMCGEDK
jgi:hypothetical protein